MTPSNREQIETHLRALVGERNPVTTPDRLAETARYVSRQFRDYGLEVREEPVAFESRTFPNIFGLLPGTGRSLFIIGAHYDSVPGTPGADDNASAVAGLLEIARRLQGVRLETSLMFCAFSLEEYGFIGSKQYARQLVKENTEVLGMVSLEMLGYRDRRPGSQTYPPYVDPSRYPDRGDFIALVGNQPSAELVLDMKGGMMRAAPRLPVEHLIVPGRGDEFQEVRLSDHSPFWELGFRAVMVTDTAFFRNPHYHQPTDTLDTLDVEFIDDVASALAGFLENYLGGPQ